MTIDSRWLVFTALLALLVGCGGGGEATTEAPAAEAPAESEAPATTAPAAATSEPIGTASITGTISYSGEVPKLPTLKMDADPGCAAKHSDPVASEVLVLGDGNTMGNVLVKVTSGLPDVQFAPPAEPAVLDQEGCKYTPHVLGVMTNQPIRILNSDGLLHNVHALPEVNKEFNMAMPASVTEQTQTFTQPEAPFKIKCDVHPWMGAWVLVSDHPFFDVTEKDGQFTISGLPAGTFEIEAWHERLGTQTATVTVGDGEAVTQDFTISR